MICNTLTDAQLDLFIQAQELRVSGALGGFGRWLFRVSFVDRDYATLMRSVLQGYKENAESLAANMSAKILSQRQSA